MFSILWKNLLSLWLWTKFLLINLNFGLSSLVHSKTRFAFLRVWFGVEFLVQVHIQR